MLIIREEQKKVFEDHALLQFEDEMVTHSEMYTPQLCKTLGEEQLRVALRQAMKRAGAYGFTNRGPIQLYIELMFLYGSDFDTDPQYPLIAGILKSSGEQMERAEEIYEFILDYQEKVSGPDAVNLYKGLEALSVQIQHPVTFSTANFEAEILHALKYVFPQKYGYVGEKGMKSLVVEAREEAQKYDFPTTRGEALLVILMFTLGHGCTTDPLYPWIARTLTNEKIIDPAGRAGRLEKKAKTWLGEVLAGQWGGEQA